MITILFIINQIYCYELLPTELKSQTLGIIIKIRLIDSFIIPSIVDLLIS